MPWRSLQATTLAGAVRRLVRGGTRRVGGRYGPGGSQHGSDGETRVLDWLGPVLPAVPVGAGPGATVAAAVRDRARAAGVPARAASHLETLWPSLDAAARRQVAAPLHVHRGARHAVWGPEGAPGPAVARQTDQTTCGSAVLVMLAAAGDPSLALWLSTGRLLPDHAPPEVRALRRIYPGARPASPQDRFGALQLVVKHVSNARALGPWGWPAALGTPPWGAARAARFPGVRFRAEMVDDADRARTSRQLARAVGALAAGIPVPLYSGGDLGSGLATAIPRHVVLLVDSDGEHFTVYEPGTGELVAISRAELLDPRGPHRALGRWTHAAWIVLPHQ